MIRKPIIIFLKQTLPKDNNVHRFKSIKYDCSVVHERVPYSYNRQNVIIYYNAMLFVSQKI